MARTYRCQKCGEYCVLGDTMFGLHVFKYYCPKCKKKSLFKGA